MNDFPPKKRVHACDGPAIGKKGFTLVGATMHTYWPNTWPQASFGVSLAAGCKSARTAHTKEKPQHACHVKASCHSSEKQHTKDTPKDKRRERETERVEALWNSQVRTQEKKTEPLALLQL